jgi:hypothetical protein
MAVTAHMNREPPVQCQRVIEEGKNTWIGQDIEEV